MEHQFNVELATRFGVEKAVIIQNLYFWINHNAKNKKHIHDGSVWTFNSSTAFAKLFPYIKERTIARYLTELENDNIIKSGKYNTNLFDKTKWYSFSDCFLYELNDLGYDVSEMMPYQNMQFDTQKMANRAAENGEPIPYNKHTDNKHKEEIDKSISQKKQRKKVFDVRADLSYVESAYADVWSTWLDYKDELKKQYKTQRGAMSAYSKFVSMCNGDIRIAQAIVSKSIENSWQGLFDLDERRKKEILDDDSGDSALPVCHPDNGEYDAYGNRRVDGVEYDDKGRIIIDGKVVKSIENGKLIFE